MSCFPGFLRFGSKTNFAYFGASHSIRMSTTAPTHSECNSAKRAVCCSSLHVLLGRTENMKCDLTTHWTNILLCPCSLLDKPRALHAHEESSSMKLQPSLRISRPCSGFISLQWSTARSSIKRLSSSEPQSGSQVAQRWWGSSFPFSSLPFPPFPSPAPPLPFSSPPPHKSSHVHFLVLSAFLSLLPLVFQSLRGVPTFSLRFHFEHSILLFP